MAPSIRGSTGDLGGREFDLLIIGGGITGAGIAREAALRGLDTALVDGGDFGSGTSSRSSRLVHGGLRYLEHRRIGLVAESLRERGILLKLAPNLVRPIEFILPIYRGDRVPGWKTHLGLYLYDWLAGRGNVRRHVRLGKRALKQVEPLLRDRGLRGGASYMDAQCDDARLTLAVIRAAAAAGARVANYNRVTGLLRGKNRIMGAQLRDVLGDRDHEVRARLVVNAAGPWIDLIRRMEEQNTPPILRPTKGSHVQVPRARIGNRHAILFNSPIDKRTLFVLPWTEWTYIGTTDIDTTETPETVQPSEAEVVYLLRSANALFPEARLAPEDVVTSWAGIRPLLAENASVPPSNVSREHRILTGSLGMITIAGGKLTTFRKMGEEVVDTVVKQLGQNLPRSPRSKTDPLPGGEGAAGLALRGPGASLGLPGSTIDYLRGRYGNETSILYGLCREEPDLARPLCASHPAIGAQVRFAVEREFARTVDDILERRIRLSIETSDRGASARPRIEELANRYLPRHEDG
jgi:glycerol-3-phosphate dehydrogenase